MVGIVLLVIIGALGALTMLGSYGPFVAVAVVIAGAIAANRMGYRHQAQAFRREMGPPSSPSVPRTAKDRLQELDELKAAGLVTEEEATRRREAILADL